MKRPKSLPGAVMTEIQRLFMREGMKVGDRLPAERELARQLAVGRSSLREAIQSLQTVGLLQVRHGVGTFFTSEPGAWKLSPPKFHDRPAAQLLAELIEARLLVEMRLAWLAAERATKEDLVRLRDAADRRAHAERGQYAEHGLNFHLAVATAAHQPVLRSMLNAVFEAYLEVLESPDSADRDREAAFRVRQQGGHDEILRMIEARDPERAAQAMAAHLRELQEEFPSMSEQSGTVNSKEEVP